MGMDSYDYSKDPLSGYEFLLEGEEDYSLKCIQHVNRETSSGVDITTHLDKINDVGKPQWMDVLMVTQHDQILLPVEQVIYHPTIRNELMIDRWDDAILEASMIYFNQLCNLKEEEEKTCTDSSGDESSLYSNQGKITYCSSIIRPDLRRLLKLNSISYRNLKCRRRYAIFICHDKKDLRKFGFPIFKTYYQCLSYPLSCSISAIDYERSFSSDYILKKHLILLSSSYEILTMFPAAKTMSLFIFYKKIKNFGWSDLFDQYFYQPLKLFDIITSKMDVLPDLCFPVHGARTEFYHHYHYPHLRYYKPYTSYLFGRLQYSLGNIEALDFNI